MVDDQDYPGRKRSAAERFLLGFPLQHRWAADLLWKRCIPSVVAQQRKPAYVVVVDDSLVRQVDSYQLS